MKKIIIFTIFVILLSAYMFIKPSKAVEGQEILDGIYEIETGVDSNKVLEVINAYTYSGANVQIFTRNNSAECQKVNVKYMGDGYYTLTFVHSNMLLDVSNGKTENHTNVWQCRENGADAQKWIIKEAGNGYYNIISKSSNKYLTVANGGTANCTNIEIDAKKGQNAQKFKFNKVKETEEIKGQKTIEDGMYEIETGVDSNKVLEVINAYTYSGANVQIFTRNNNANCQKVNVKYMGEGYYTLTFLHSNMLLDVSNGKTENHTNVWQCRKNGADAQKWIIKEAGNGYYNIISKSSNKYLTVANGGTANCTNIEIDAKNGQNAQKFKFNKVKETEEIKGQKTIEDGMYEIETGVDSNKVLEVINAYTYSGANVQIFTRNNNANCQKVNVKYMGEGYYTLTFLHSNMLLDVSNGKTEDHTNVWQCRENGADAQKWIIKEAGNGYYNIISKSSNKYLTVANGGTANCTNIEIDAKKGQNAQKFKFNKVKETEEIKGQKTIEDGMYEIETGVDSNKVLEVINAYTYSGANVQIFTRNNNANCQKVNVKYMGDGYYTLTFVHSNMLLDVANGKTADHTNVWQCRENGADAQKWIIKDIGDGYYNIISKSSNKYLTVANGGTSNCTNIEINSNNGQSSQKFKFNKITQSKELEDGLYEIETGVDSNKVLDVINAYKYSGANVQIFTKNKANCQKVIVKRGQDGYYTLTFLHSEMLLDVANGQTADHTNVWQCRKNGADAQKWIIKEAGNGYYNIISKSSNKYLTVANGGTANCTNIEITSGNGQISQKFKFNKLNEVYGTRTIADGLYEIETGVDSNKALDVINAYKNSGANVQIFTKNNANCQKVNVRYLGEGYYNITFLHSKMLLDVENGQTADHTNVWQCRANGTDAQKWIIKDVGNGYYNIISKLSGTYLTVANGGTANCTNIEINSNNGQSSQRFKFNSTKPNYTINIDSNKYPGYKEAIEKLMAAHPTWNFEFLYTGLKFSDAVYGEYSNHSANLVETTAGEWLCTKCGTHQYYPGWYGASDKAIAYYMDPRNFLNESNIFQFLDVNEYNFDSVSLSGIQTYVNNTFLKTYAEDVNTACKNTNVNPYYVVSRLIQENGRGGSATSNGMDGGDGKLYYNPFNIGANGDDVIGNALKRAKAEGWDSMEKAIEGGIAFLKKNWLENYQNTLYQNRFDIDSTNGSALYAHQYMQNLLGAYSEAKTLKSCYDNSNKLDSYFTFIIPLYEGMSTTLAQKPSNQIGVEEYPMNVIVNTNSDTLALRENASTNSNVIERLPKGTVLLSIKRGVNSTWQEVVTKEGKIGYMSGEYLKQINDEIVCNYQGYIKTEHSGGINVRTGPSTLSSAGFSKIEYLKDYTKVTVIDDSTYKGYEISEWVQWSRIILDDGRQAFIPSSYVKK